MLSTFYVKIESSFDVGEHTVPGASTFFLVNAGCEADAYRRAEGMLTRGETVAGVGRLIRAS